MPEHGTDAEQVVELPIGGVFATAGLVRIKTLLGSCVSSCLYDPATKTGGMNHILLPGCMLQDDQGLASRYGVHAMELLINRITRLGGARYRLRAKVFGGARLLTSAPKLTNVGALNSRFVLDFLASEHIPLDAYSLGGTTGMTVWFEPATGKALIRRIPENVGRELASREQMRGAEVFRAANRVSDHNVTLF